MSHDPMNEPMFDVRVHPRACTICKSEDVAPTDEWLPSGIAPKIRCDVGHVTGGVPTADWFAMLDRLRKQGGSR